MTLEDYWVHKIQLLLKKIIILVAPVFFQKIRFYRTTKYWPSLKNPTTINENIFVLKVKSSKADYKYVDKLLAQNFIRSQIEENNFCNLFLPEILVESADAEHFISKLPNCKCFIKANHGSGMCMLYKPENGLDEIGSNKLKDWLEFDYAFFSGEECYSNIERKLFAERLLTCKDGSLPDDIKVHCCNGKPLIIQVLRRASGELERQTFDSNWNSKNWFQNETLQTDLSSVPRNDVTDYAAKLAESFVYVRVDFYLVDSKLYFSELTLFPASASLPLLNKEIDLMLGRKFFSFA